MAEVLHADHQHLLQIDAGEKESPLQRIFMDKELTVAPFVITTSVFCCRKPEALRKMTPEPLLAELYTAQSFV